MQLVLSDSEEFLTTQEVTATKTTKKTKYEKTLPLLLSF